MAIFNPEDSKFYCECGCGTQIPFCNSYVFGHQSGTPEARKRLSEIGKVTVKSMQTPEARRKARQSMQRNWDSLTPGERKTRMEISVGSEAAKIARLETFRTPEYRARLGRINDGNWAMLTPEERVDYMSKSLNSDAARKASVEAFRTPETRARNSRARKAFWASLTFREKMDRIRNSFGSSSMQVPNRPEAQLQKFLERFFPDLFIPDWIERIDIGGRHPDFRTKNGYKLVIESNGYHWHGDWGEEEQVAHYRQFGYDCIVTWNDTAEDVIAEWPKLATRIREALVK